MREHQAYIERETLKGVLISVALSLVFAMLILGIQPMIPLYGPRGLIVDSIPQTFMVTLLGTLVPTLMTRRDLAAGNVACVSSKPLALPRNAFLRALCLAATATVILGAAHALLLPFIGFKEWPFSVVLAYKAVYGGALAALVVPVAVRQALAD